MISEGLVCKMCTHSKNELSQQNREKWTTSQLCMWLSNLTNGDRARPKVQQLDTSNNKNQHWQHHKETSATAEYV